MRSVIIISILLTLLSCTPERKLAYLLKHHPELRNLKDTVSLDTTVITKGSRVDTSFIFQGDTVYIRDGKQEIKYYYNTTNHHNYISGSVTPDTIHIEKKVPIDRVVYQEKESSLKWWAWVILGFFLATIFIFQIDRFTKRYLGR